MINGAVHLLIDRMAPGKRTEDYPSLSVQFDTGL